MNNLKVFDYDGQEVRTVEHDSSTWWVLKDVCEVLELSDTNKVGERLDSDELTRIKIVSGGQNREMYIINESGLYNVIIRSDKPESKRFKRWITHEVLPSIRKHGLYAMDEMLENPDALINALQALKAEREAKKKLHILSTAQKQQIAELQPKATYYDLILQNKSTLSITQIAKDYGMSATSFNRMLHDLGIQYKMSNTWFLYQKYADCGYTQTRTYSIDAERSSVHTYWTQKGRLFLYDLLKSKKGILPMIERK